MAPKSKAATTDKPKNTRKSTKEPVDVKAVVAEAIAVSNESSSDETKEVSKTVKKQSLTSAASFNETLKIIEEHFHDKPVSHDELVQLLNDRGRVPKQCKDFLLKKVAAPRHKDAPMKHRSAYQYFQGTIKGSKLSTDEKKSQWAAIKADPIAYKVFQDQASADLVRYETERVAFNIKFPNEAQLPAIKVREVKEKKVVNATTEEDEEDE